VPDKRAQRAQAGRRLAGDPTPGLHHVSTGTAEILADWDDPDGWMVLVNGVPSSYLNLADPTRLEFEYMRWMGDLLDLAAPPGEPVRTLHLGGAGCTLARYVAHTRPGSPQLVFELDPGVVELVRSSFGRYGTHGFKVRTVEARAGLALAPDDSRDVLVRDAFLGASVPDHLATLEFAREAARVLETGGLYLANVADQAAAPHARVEAATLLAVFENVAMIGEPGQLRGRRFGNVVLVASDGPLPLDGLARRLAGGAVPARLVLPDRVRELAAGHQPRTDAAVGYRPGVDDPGSNA
jgi:spermidine synthase